MKLLLFAALFFNGCIPAIASLNDVDKMQVFNKNMLLNGGFESGKSLWTASTAAHLTVTTSSPMVGKMHGVYDAAAAADTLTSTAVTIPVGYYGRNMTASCLFTVASGTATHEIQAYDGSNVLVEASITSSTTPTRTSVVFIAPSSGSLQLRIYANANEPSITIDDCYLGPAEGYNFANLSTAEFVGSAYIPNAVNCVWQRTNTATGAMGTDADCSGPTVEYELVGDFQTTDADLPRFTINNLPPGRYHVKMNFPAAASSASTIQCWAVSDGTTTGKENCFSGVTDGNMDVWNDFVYTTTGNRSFEVYGSASTGTISLIVSAANRNLRMSVFRYPITDEKAYTPDKLANSWSGYHADDCVFARSGTSLDNPTADATCTFTQQTNASFGTVTSYESGGNKLPGIVFTPSRAGRYFICAAPTVRASASASVYSQLETTGGFTIDRGESTNPGTNYIAAHKLCGIIVATSTSSITLRILLASTAGVASIQTTFGDSEAVFWSIFQIDQSFPAPLIANSVVTNNSGVQKIIAGELNCDAGSAITSQTGTTSDGVSSIGNLSSGACSVSFAAGTYSAAPYCFSEDTVASNPNVNVNITSITTSGFTLDCESSSTGNDCSGYDARFLCVGSK